jgi:hypothetical protein
MLLPDSSSMPDVGLVLTIWEGPRSMGDDLHDCDEKW